MAETYQGRIATLAEDMAHAFRDCGAQDERLSYTRRCLDEDHRHYETVREMVRAAHNEMGMDFAYRAVETVLDALSEADVETIEEADYHELYVEPDIYTSDLTSWVSESVYHMGYCDQVLQELGPFDSLTAVIQAAQEAAYRDAFIAVVSKWPHVEEEDDDE